MAGYGFNIGLDGHRADPLTDRDAEEIAEGLKIIYGNARERMLKTVANRLSRGVRGYGWAERKAGEILDTHHQMQRIYDRAARQRESLLRNVTERAWVKGNQKFYADMRSVLGTAAHISPNGMKAGYILADLNNALNAAERRILRQFDDKYADIIGAVSAEMATGVMNTRKAVGEALQRFADEGITGFIDRGGHHWTLENYSEMAVLTAIERATVSGYVDTMQSYGYDLAVIDGHAGSCPICEAWEGVIVSVSGNNHDYPSLDEAEGAGCFHPRCLHGITTYYPDITHEPRGGFRDEPREVREPSRQYTARSRQRYCERMAQKYRDRALVAQTPQQKRQATNKAREWSKEAERQRELQYKKRSRTESEFSFLPAKRNTINPEYINSDDYASRFSGSTKSEAADQAIARLAREMLNHRSGTNFEDLALVDARSGEVLYLLSSSDVPNGVKYDNGILDAIETALTNGKEIVSLHNHPNNFPPSLDDGVSALIHGYSSGVVVCHDGRIYGFTPTSVRLTNDECAEVHRIITDQVMQEMSMKPWLTTLSEYGMVVTER